MQKRMWLFAALLSCSAAAKDHTASEEHVPTANGQAALPEAKLGAAKDESATYAERESAPASRAIALITDAAALAAVADGGLGLDRLVPSTEWSVIAKSVAQDIARAGRGDANAGVGIRGHSHRLFDERWLRSTKTRFELVGITYRIDRIPLTPGACGDIRLIYRLAYTTKIDDQSANSRLPMTVAVVLRGSARDATSGCKDAAQQWVLPQELSGAELGRHLISEDGPLFGATAADVTLVLTNLQVVRWPSAVRPDLGGHAEYALRAFRKEGGALRVSTLDNTPDVARIKNDRGLQARLATWLQDPATVPAIDSGNFELPTELLATSAVSVAPRGFSRLANRPYRQLIKDGELAGSPLAGTTRIASQAALVRRLDEQNCIGCHQSRTIAGFHLLGEDGSDVVPGNALAVSQSPHLISEANRRARLIETVAAGKSPNFDRPSVTRDPSEVGHSGVPCGLGDPGFASWTCAPGNTCIAYDSPADDRTVGMCVAQGDAAVGEACEFGAIKGNVNPKRDRDPKSERRNCGGGAVCNNNRVGFPGGMCTSGCNPLPENGACGVIALLGPFNACLARREPFPECLRQHVSPAGLRRCDADTPCREDYICARTPNGQGACTPPYFLFQLRVDGHNL